MKKLLGIIVLGLLLSGNAYAEDLNLTCNYITGQTHYETKIEINTRDEMLNSGLPVTIDKVFIINSKTKKILRQKYSGEFVPLSKSKDNFDIVWSNQNIIWSYQLSVFDGMFYKTILDRSSGILVDETFHGKKSNFKKQTGMNYQKSEFKCELTKKLF
tara:strand:+ start:26 stop:499 length:474 start_codon:yes stop_codon:yes gene_type:complete